MSKLNSPTARLALLLNRSWIFNRDPESDGLVVCFIRRALRIFSISLSKSNPSSELYSGRRLCEYRHDFASFNGIFRTSWICGFGSPDAGYTPADCPLSSRKEKRVLENYGLDPRRRELLRSLQSLAGIEPIDNCALLPTEIPV